jgi:hypothetical protein
MRLGYVVLVIALGSVAVAQTAPDEFVGCLSQDANGTFLLGTVPSGRTYSLIGPVNLLQRNLNETVAMTAHVTTGTARPSLAVESVRTVTQSCTAPLPSDNKLKVAGKVGIVQVAVPITLAGNADKTTPGFQTENGMDQGEKIKTRGAVQSPRSPFKPVRADQAGQSIEAADMDAQAAARAELYPGTTLGVDIKSAPPSSLQSLTSQTGSTNPGQAK